MGGSGTSSSVKIGVSGTNNIGHCGTYFVRIKGRGVSGTRYIVKMCMHCPWMDASGWHSGDEWLKRKEILKTMVSGMAKLVKSAFQLKMVMLWNKIFLSFVKIICSGMET